MTHDAITPEEIYRAFYPKVRAYVRGRIANCHDAEELVSAVFLKVVQKLDSYDPAKASLSTWVYTITRNTVTDFFRSRRPVVALEDYLAVEVTDAQVDDDALEAALQSGKVKRYITDFPNDRTAGMAGVVAIPHLGASTEEAEDNCAMMAVRQVMDYLENGNIKNSVNYPACDMGICTKPGRIVVLHKNIPNTISRFTTAVASFGINISDMLNRSKGEYAVTMMDIDDPTPAGVVEKLGTLEGVFRVRVIQ